MKISKKQRREKINTHLKPHYAIFLMVCMVMFTAILCVNLTSAFEFDNIQEVTETIGDAGYNDIEIYNSWLIPNVIKGDILWSGILDYNTEKCGINCEAIQTITLHEKGSLVDELIFKTLQEDGSWIEQPIRSYQVYIKTGEEEKIIDDYEYQCSDGKYLIINNSYEQICNEVQVGTHKEIIKIWGEYVLGTELETGTYEVRLIGEKKPSRTVDWIYKTQGEWLEEWAVWTAGAVDQRFYHGFTEQGVEGASALTAGVRIKVYGEDMNISAIEMSENCTAINGSIGTTKKGSELGNYTFTGNIAVISPMIILSANTEYWISGYGDGANYDSPYCSSGACEAGKLQNEFFNWTGRVDHGGTQSTIGYNCIWALNITSLNNSIILNSPIDNFETIEKTIEFNATATPNGGATLVNMSLWHNGTGVWHRNLTEDLLGTTNTSILNSTFSSGTYLWGYEACDSDGDCGFSENRTIIINPLIVDSQTFNNVTFSGAEETFILNFTLALGTTISDAVMDYNGTNYTSSIISITNGTKFRLSNTINVPIVNNNTNFTFNFLITVVDGQVYGTQKFTQLVAPLNITDCSSGGTVILNMSLFDERLKTKITGDIEVNVQALDKSSLEEAGFVNLLFNNTENAAICLSLVEALDNLFLDAEIKYYSDGYASELYYIQRADLNDVPINLSLFDLSNNDSTEFLLTYQDDNLIFVEEAIIQLQRKYIAEDLFEVVEAPLTSDEGTAIVHIDLDTNKYQVTVVKDGVVLDIFNNLVFFCENELSGQCSQKLLGQIDSQNDIPIENLLDFSYGITQNNDSIVTLFSIPSGVPASVNVLLIQTDQFNNTNICNETVFSSAGSISCPIIPTIGDSFLDLTISKSSVKKAEKSYIVKEDLALDFLGNNYFILFIMLLSIVGMAFTSPEWIVINGVVTMVIAGAIYLANGVDFVVGLGNLIWLVIAAVILILKISHQEDR